jgi:hypothetical protein
MYLEAAGLIQTGLIRLPLYPPVCRHGILPEELFDGVQALLREVLMDQAQRFAERPHGFAVGPVTCEQETVRTERFPDFIQPRTIKAQLTRDSSRRSDATTILIDALKNLGNLHVYLRAFSEFSKSVQISIAGCTFIGDRHSQLKLHLTTVHIWDGLRSGIPTILCEASAFES